MSSILRRFLLNKTLTRFKYVYHAPKTKIASKYFIKPYHFLTLLGGVTFIYTTYYYTNIFKNVHEIKLDLNEKTSSREKRFIKFASIKYKDQLFMTPKDFMESLIEIEPNLQKKARILTKNELISPIFDIPNNKGIISYMEYLFLLSILKRPESGFKIAFDMLDTDKNRTIGKNEFLIMENVFNHKLLSKGNLNKNCFKDTTLIIYFFGVDGTKKLTYEQFHKFIINFQNEVLRFEFNQYSNNSHKISELDFVKILLKHSNLETNVYEQCLQKVLNRLRNPVGITFKEFESFNKLLTNLDDVSVAFRMFKLAQHSISKKDFNKISKICGCDLTQHLIDLIFTIFDGENGSLDYNEFVIVMRNRINRGFVSNEKHSWKNYQQCVRNEMKAAKFV
ncbi:calcium uptake protein 3, mitochondrial-like isoform X1 [Onthophagus taurus]|uniref:calcium uptake protein 3, mitochondrial-like isoform X1 n=1 Tax=Onthophagus taurus TaxID=166361 RepID=UPI0039BE3AD8